MKRGSMDSVFGSYRPSSGQSNEFLLIRKPVLPLAGEFRKRIVSGFPYNIIYRVWQDYIYLVAVAHHSRRPGYWRKRSDRR